MFFGVWDFFFFKIKIEFTVGGDAHLNIRAKLSSYLEQSRFE